MAEVSQYIDIMVESLLKKSSLLDDIIESNNKLETVIGESELDMESFRQLLDAKDSCVNQINRLDEGFESLFHKIKDELHNNKEQYRQQILNMQRLIRTITDKAVQIQETESKQRLAIEGQFARKRKELRTAKQGISVAQNYYKNMSKLNVVDAQFLDKKN